MGLTVDSIVYSLTGNLEWEEEEEEEEEGEEEEEQAGRDIKTNNPNLKDGE